MTQARPIPPVSIPIPTDTAAREQVPIVVQLPPDKPDYTGDLLSGGIGLIGGLVGALAGAFAAYQFGLKAAREANDRADKRRDRQLRFAVTQKLNKIYATQRDIRTTCDEAVARLAASRAAAALEGINFLDHLCMELRPFATSITRLSFSSDEVGVVGRTGDMAALKVMMMLDDRHNTTADLLDEFRGLKSEFEAIVHENAEFDPNRGYMQFRWSQEEYTRYRPRLFKMDGLATAIHKHSALDEKDAYTASLAVAKASAKVDGEKVDIRITTPDGRIARVRSSGVEFYEEKDLPPIEGAPS